MNSKRNADVNVKVNECNLTNLQTFVHVYVLIPSLTQGHDPGANLAQS